MACDPNVLLNDIVDACGERLKRLDEEPIMQVGKDGELYPVDPIDTKLKIGAFLTSLTTSRTRAAQGWMRLQTEMGRDAFLHLIDDIEGRRKLTP